VQIVEMRELIKRLGGEHTVLLSSHNLSEISQTCDRLLVIHEGRVAADGTEDSISQSAGGGARVVEITVEGNVPGGGVLGERAAAVIGKVPGVLTARVKSSADGRADLEVEASDDRRAAVAKALIDAGISLVRLDRKAVELESIFQRLVAPTPGGGSRRAA
jgi:ABC-2 type transport system ATP-binding protein